MAKLDPERPRVWVTGTSSPCISVFKPVDFEPLPGLAAPGPTPDESLWWRHERLHRVALRDYRSARASFASERDAFQEEAWTASPGRAIWSEHADRVDEWLSRVRDIVRGDRRSVPARLYWRRQNRLDQLS